MRIKRGSVESPEVEGDTIIVPHYPYGHVYIDTDDFVVFWHFTGGGHLWYFFLGPKPRQVRWSELDDKHRFQFRIAFVVDGDPDIPAHRVSYLKYNGFPYKDERYHAIEALEGL